MKNERLSRWVIYQNANGYLDVCPRQWWLEVNCHKTGFKLVEEIMARNLAHAMRQRNKLLLMDQVMTM